MDLLCRKKATWKFTFRWDIQIDLFLLLVPVSSCGAYFGAADEQCKSMLKCIPRLIEKKTYKSIHRIGVLLSGGGIITSRKPKLILDDIVNNKWSYFRADIFNLIFTSFSLIKGVHVYVTTDQRLFWNQ